MKAAELRDMTDKELEEKLKISKTELFNLRFQHAAGQMENPHRIEQVKRDIARILTVMAERQMAGGKGKEIKKSAEVQRSARETGQKVAKPKSQEPRKNLEKTRARKTKALNPKLGNSKEKSG